MPQYICFFSTRMNNMVLALAVLVALAISANTEEIPNQCGYTSSGTTVLKCASGNVCASTRVMTTFPFENQRLSFCASLPASISGCHCEYSDVKSCCRMKPSKVYNITISENSCGTLTFNLSGSGHELFGLT